MCGALSIQQLVLTCKLQTQTASTSCYSNRHGGCSIAAFCDGGGPSVAEKFLIEVISDLCCSSSFFVSACSQYFAILLLSSHDSPNLAGFGTFGVICTAQHQSSILSNHRYSSSHTSLPSLHSSYSRLHQRPSPILPTTTPKISLGSTPTLQALFFFSSPFFGNLIRDIKPPQDTHLAGQNSKRRRSFI